MLSYAYVYYGLIFDDYSPIIGAIEQTNWQEIWPLITWSFLIWFLFLGALPAYVIYKAQLSHFSFFKDLSFRLLGVSLYPIFFLTIILPNLPTCQPMLRLSGLAARLPYQIIPTNFAEGIFNHYKTKLIANLPYKQIGLDATQTIKSSDQKNNLLILVVGETARSMDFKLNGYNRNTNPYTEKQNVISFKRVSSCATATRLSIPCMFSSFTRKDFFQPLASHQDNLLDILKRVGLNLKWIDNNGAGDCQGVCKNIDTSIIHDHDIKLVEALSLHISENRGKDTIIVLHLEGSHGPNYYARYPESFGKFKPECRKNELRLCNKNSLLNSYDNSIVYTDFVINKIINLLKKQHGSWNTALIYTSDHGESIGENGLYGHCAPYLIAPREQTQVPLIIWTSKSLANDKNISIDCLKNKALHGEFSHDNIFHSVLGLMDVNTNVYQGSLDLFKSCRST